MKTEKDRTCFTNQKETKRARKAVIVKQRSLRRKSAIFHFTLTVNETSGSINDPILAVCNEENQSLPSVTVLFPFFPQYLSLPCKVASYCGQVTSNHLQPKSTGLLRTSY